MALTLSSGADLIAADAFQRRVAAGFYLVAREVVTEDPATHPGHENRARFALSVVFQPYTAFLQYAAMVATDDTIVTGGPYTDLSTQPTDAVILTAIRDMWNVLSHVQT